VTLELTPLAGSSSSAGMSVAVAPPSARFVLRSEASNYAGAACAAGAEIVAYVEPVAVGDILPDRPIFLTSDFYVNCPLEATYEAAWSVFPAVLKAPLESPGGAPD
jgi:hypothetical protein